MVLDWLTNTGRDVVESPGKTAFGTVNPIGDRLTDYNADFFNSTIGDTDADNLGYFGDIRNDVNEAAGPLLGDGSLLKGRNLWILLAIVGLVLIRPFAEAVE